MLAIAPRCVWWGGDPPRHCRLSSATPNQAVLHCFLFLKTKWSVKYREKMWFDTCHTYIKVVTIFRWKKICLISCRCHPQVGVLTAFGVPLGQKASCVCCGPSSIVAGAVSTFWYHVCNGLDFRIEQFDWKSPLKIRHLCLCSSQGKICVFLYPKWCAPNPDWSAWHENAIPVKLM